MESKNSDLLRQKLILSDGAKPPPLSPAQSKASLVWSIGALVAIGLILIAVRFGNDTVLLDPDFSDRVPFHALIAFAVIIWILMAIRLRSFG